MSNDPIADAAADIVPHDGSAEDLRMQLQEATEKLLDMQKKQKDSNKAFNDMIKDLKAEITDISTQLKATKPVAP